MQKSPTQEQRGWSPWICLYSALPEALSVISSPYSVARRGDSAYSLLTSLLLPLHASFIGKIRSKRRNQILDPWYTLKVNFQCKTEFWRERYSVILRADSRSPAPPGHGHLILPQQEAARPSSLTGERSSSQGDMQWLRVSSAYRVPISAECVQTGN